MNFPQSGFLVDIASLRWLMPAIFSLAILGLLFDLARDKPRAARETFANLGLQVGLMVIRAVIGGGVALFLWTDRLALWHLPTNFVSAAAVFVLVDLAYYWQHRCEHSVALLWAMHQVHHSGNEFNFSTAVRGSWFTRVMSWLFVVPLVILGFSPGLVLSFQFFNLLFQMAKHNDVIGSLGWLDRVLGTPYNHRAHHGRKTLGKNLGGMFMVWDRLFGTYASGTVLHDFGVPQPPGTYNPVLLQTRPIANLFQRFRSQKGLHGKFQALFGPPGPA